MKSYRIPKVKVGPSTQIEGQGIIAIDFIPKGEIVCVKTGHIITTEQLRHFTPIVKQFCLQIEDDLFIGPHIESEFADSSLYINHSCDPNVGMIGQISHVSMRDIYPGEELTQDYAMIYTSPVVFPDMQCLCGSQYCRNTITCNDWKRPELQERYGEYFSTFILRKIRST